MKALYQRLKEDPLYGLICMGLIILPVSNAVGQVPLYLASVGWLIQVLRGKAPFCRRTQGFLLGFSLIILASIFYSVHPENGIGKLNRFLIFPLAGAVTAACLREKDSTDRAMGICVSLVAGVSIRGLYDLVKFPLAVYGGQKFEHVGNMTSPQFYLMGILLLLGMRTFRPQVIGKAFWFCLPLISTGLLLHQKRGVWLASLVAIGLWTLWMRHWKILISLTLMAGLSLFLPFVQVRLHRLIEVVQPTHGGRMILWNQVAPRLLPEYPFGMGYNASTYEDFRKVLPREYHMEEGLRHLHNNFLQIRLELGWHGVLFWTVWMMSILWVGFRRSPKEDAALRYAVAFALLALMLNGLVEYNFGDSEILKAYLVLFGLLDVFSMRRVATQLP